MQELKTDLEQLFREATLVGPSFAPKLADRAMAAIEDAFRDAGWLPPDEVCNASGDLQLAATKLWHALHLRLVTDSEPPLGPLVEGLAQALEPYQRAPEEAP